MTDQRAGGSPSGVAARMLDRAAALEAMATEEAGFGNRVTVAHLNGKAEGLRLAVSYMKEAWSVDALSASATCTDTSRDYYPTTSGYVGPAPTSTSEPVIGET